MKNDIKDKLRIELDKPMHNEGQVVYILSRIRKILEIDNNKGKYKKLKFYCDWALHAQIENTEPIEEVLGTVVNESQNASDFFNYRPLDEDLKRFLTDYDLPQSIYASKESVGEFKKLLTKIYSDTPLIIKQVEKTKITIHEEIVLGSYGISYSIVYDD